MAREDLKSLGLKSMNAAELRLVPERELRACFKEPREGDFELAQLDEVILAAAYRWSRFILRAGGALLADQALMGLFHDRKAGKTGSQGLVDTSVPASSDIVGLIDRDLVDVVLGNAPEASEQRDLAFSVASRVLEVPPGSPMEASMALLRARPDLMPSEQELSIYEHRLLSATYDEIVERGFYKARRALIQDLGLSSREAQELVSLSRMVMAGSIEIDQETERKVQSDRLERLMAEAREAMDQRLELAAIKERNRLLGLTDRPPQDTQKEIMDVIATVVESQEGGSRGSSGGSYTPTFDIVPEDG